VQKYEKFSRKMRRGCFFYVFSSKKYYIYNMNKLFSSFNRFLALFACVSLLMFACSDEKAPSHEEICQSNKSECLAGGSWALESIEDANPALAASKVTASGTIIFNKDGTYEANSVKVGNSAAPFDHSGEWELNGNTITVMCGNGDRCSGNTSGDIEFADNYSVLKIRAPDGAKTPFAFRNPDPYSMPNPIEKYRFKP
jgi:hypothetical protein